MRSVRTPSELDRCNRSSQRFFQSSSPCFKPAEHVHHHAGRAKAALQGVAFLERLPANAGIQRSAQKLGPRFRGDERMAHPTYGSSRTGSAALAMNALASRTENSPKWKIEAASTALA